MSDHAAARLGSDPLAAPPPAPHPAVHSPPRRRVAPRRLLVVRGDPSDREALASYLEGHGWEVTRAGSLRAAVEGLIAARPTHLLIDLDLPDGPGESLLSVARALRPSPRTALLVDRCDRRRLRALLELAPDAVLPKPAGIGDVTMALGPDAV